MAMYNFFFVDRILEREMGREVIVRRNVAMLGLSCDNEEPTMSSRAMMGLVRGLSSRVA